MPVSDQMETIGRQAGATAESVAAQAGERAEALRSGVASSQRLTRAKRRARRVQAEAAKRGHEISEEAAARGRAAARHASKEAKKRGAAAVAAAPAAAVAARKKGEYVIERAIEVARDRGGDALLSALDTDPGKRIASTHAGSALKSKLTARKRRRRKLLLLVAGGAGGAIALKRVRGRRAAGEGSDFTLPVADLPATGTVTPDATGTAAGAPIAGVVEEAVAKTAKVGAETEPPAMTAGVDGELKTESEAESS